MNTKLLLQVKAHILEEPRRIWMSTVLATGLVPDSIVPRGYEDGLDDWYKSRGRLRLIPACKTVGCIAGWSCLLSNHEAYIPTGYDLLGLESTQGRTLFFVENWPEPFKSRYPKCRTPKQRAKCVADRIDKFIESDGTV